MGGGEKDKANQMADQQYAKENAASQDFSQQQAGERVGAKARSDDLYSSISGGYKDLANQRLTLDQLGGPITSRGGYSAPQFTRDPGFATSLADYRKFADTGGIDSASMRQGEGTMREGMSNGLVDDARKASIEDTINSFKGIGKTGGLDDAAMQRMQGNGGFDEFAATGGLNASDRANIRSRATSVIPATMATTNAQADRMRSVQGGYGPGTLALKSRLLRSANTDNAAAARDAELGIMQQVNQGRQYGISGMADSAQKAQTLRTGNMLQGLSGASAADSDLMHTIQSGKMWGADSITSAEAKINELEQQGKMFGTQGTQGIAQSNQDFSDRQAQANASAANSNAGAANSVQAQNIALQQYLAEFNRGNQTEGLGGLSSLYGATPSEVAMYDQNNLNNRGMSNSSQNTVIGQKLSNNNSAMQNFTGVLGGVSSIAGAAAGGLGAISGVRKPRQVMAG